MMSLPHCCLLLVFLLGLISAYQTPINKQSQQELLRDNTINFMVKGDFQDSNPSSVSSTEHATTATAHPPVNLPFAAGLGFLWHSARGRHHKYMERLRKKYGNSYIIWNKYVVIADPDAIQDVLETHNLPRSPDVTRGYRALFGSEGGLLAAPHKEWQKQRRILAQPFTLPAIRILQLSGKIEECTRPFLQVVDQAADTSTSVEMDSLFTDVTLDIIGNIVVNRTFGMCERRATGREDSSSASNYSPFVDSTMVLLSESKRQMTLPPSALKRRPKFLLRKVHRARAVIDDFLEDCIATREREDNSQMDLLQTLLQAERGGEISRDQLKTQLFTLVFAGHETTAHTLSYMLWEISQNKTLQDMLEEEIRTTTLPELSDDMSLFQRSTTTLAEQLPWLDRTFTETLRKHPVTATGTMRYVDTQSPIVVGNGLELPPGVSVSIPPWSVHRNEKYWPNPEQFDPSRFVDDASYKNTPAFQAFSGGPRSCLGSKLARAEALHIMAPLLRRYEVTCEERTEPDDFVDLTRRPRRGINFHFRRRSD